MPLPVPLPVPEQLSVRRFDHERLEVYRASLDFVVAASTLIGQLAPGHAHLANQLSRAATSITLNIAEGAGEHSRREKSRFYRMARRSATECAAILDIFERLGLVDAGRVGEGREMLIRIVSMLVRMTQNLEQPGTGRGTGTEGGRNG